MKHTPREPDWFKGRNLSMDEFLAKEKAKDDGKSTEPRRDDVEEERDISFMPNKIIRVPRGMTIAPFKQLRAKGVLNGKIISIGEFECTGLDPADLPEDAV